MQHHRVASIGSIYYISITQDSSTHVDGDLFRSFRTAYSPHLKYIIIQSHVVIFNGYCVQKTLGGKVSDT